MYNFIKAPKDDIFYLRVIQVGKWAKIVSTDFLNDYWVVRGEITSGGKQIQVAFIPSTGGYTENMSYACTVPEKGDKLEITF